MGREFNGRNRATTGEGEHSRMGRELNGRNRDTIGERERGRVGREFNGRNRETTGEGERGRMGREFNNRSRETTGQSVNRNAHVNTTADVNGSGNVRLDARQRSRIHSAIFADRHIPRLSRSRVDFDVRVDAVVPRRVHLAAVPEDVVRIYPRFRRDRVVIIEDEVVIVDPVTFRIIAVLPA
jgi:hypothetical protein